MQSSEIRKVVDGALTRLLSSRGFGYKSSLFSRPSEDVIHLLQLQGSDENTRAASHFTVNVGVWSSALVPEEKPSFARAHWQQRLGFLSPERRDLWWHAADAEQARAIGSEIAERVERYALPALALLPNSRSLLTLWRSGSSPGITRVQASRFSAALQADASEP